jgi:hypothetical protein
MVNRRTFLKFLGLAPVVAAVPRLIIKAETKETSVIPTLEKSFPKNAFLSPEILHSGKYQMVHSVEGLHAGDLVIVDSTFICKKVRWSSEYPTGIAVGDISAGNYGFVMVTNV